MIEKTLTIPVWLSVVTIMNRDITKDYKSGQSRREEQKQVETMEEEWIEEKSLFFHLLLPFSNK